MRAQILSALLPLLVLAPQTLTGGTVAYWRFEGDGAVTPVAGGSIAHTSSRTQATVTGGVPVVDVSGNGNTLYGWNTGSVGMRYNGSIPGPVIEPAGQANAFSLENVGNYPRAFTWSSQSAPSGTNIDTFQPLAWTVEASVFLDRSAATGWRTFLCRSGYGVAASDPNMACLYFQKGAGGNLRIVFVDASGMAWNADDPDPFVPGRWYHVAAVSDGETLRLYRWDAVAMNGYALVAETDLSASPDPRLAADVIDGSSLPLDEPGDPMNWSVGSAMYGSGGVPENGHVDRWFGMIDEVRISDEALTPDQFLFAGPFHIVSGESIPETGGSKRFQIEWESAEGGFYRVLRKESLTAPWVPLEAGIPATPPANSWTSAPSTDPRAFFSVEPEAPVLTLGIDPAAVLHEVDERIYGHFLEHIYHSVNGGLWGDLIWNRSFETWPAGAEAWSIVGDELVQSTLATDARIEFGDPGWGDYELTLQAQKDSGDEGFLIMFRSTGDSFYWLNLGGWGNVEHAVQKEVNGVRTTVSPVVAGSITTGQWYDIRIRCEGGHYQFWLDGSLLLDWTDLDAPLLSGRCGLATWATRASFRNILVEDLSGTELYSELPDPGAIHYDPEHWTFYGPATISHSGDAANSDDSVEITKADADEGGVVQAPFRFDVQAYSGSFWAKSSAGNDMVVRMRGGDGSVLAQQTITTVAATWQKYPFTLTPAVQDLNASLEIGVLGTGTVWLDQVSLMGQDAIDVGGYRPDLLAAADGLKPPVIRWPGGCFASSYRWKYGIGPQDDRRVHPLVQWDDQDVNAYGTDEFLRMCEEIGAEPILVVNVGIGYACGANEIESPYPDDAELLQDALDWVEYCNGPVTSTWGAVRAANGHPEPYNVKYWEIDNETWSRGADWYAAKVNLFAPALRMVDPSIELIACGGGGYDQGWNQAILDQCAAEFDYISVHNYFDAGGWATEPGNYENYLVDLGTRIAASANPDIKIFNSEWNAQSIDLRTGLFAGGLLNVYERQGEMFKIGAPALMYRHQSATAWNNAFINFDHTGSFVAPNYVVMKLWRDHFQPQRIGVTGDQGALNLVATRSDDGTAVVVKVINPQLGEVPVSLQFSAGTSIASADLKFVTAASLNTENSLSDPDAVRVKTGIPFVHGQAVRVTLPGHSASVVTVAIP